MLKPGEHKVLENKRTVCGVSLYVVGMRLPDSSEYLIVVTDKKPETALEDYAKRWDIETLFGCLKKKGFDFECTHVSEPDRLQKLFALMAIAYCWCVFTGEWLNSVKEIKLKKHGRKEISLFLHGLCELREILLNMGERSRILGKWIRRFFEAASGNGRIKNNFNSEISCFLSCT